MKKIFHALFMSLSTFTIIPPLYKGWDEDAKKYMIIMIPFIGAIIGGLYYLLHFLLTLINLPIYVNALFYVIFPLLITGCIHFDGFLDVVDAKKSYRSLEERIKILKDPHVGSFAVIFGIIITLSGYALFLSLKEDTKYLFLVFIPIISRSMSGLMLTIIKPLSVSQYNNPDAKGFKIFKIIYFIVIILAMLTLMYVFMGIYALVGVGLVLIHLLACFSSYISLKGINGDVSGYAITISEYLCIAVIIILQVIL